MEIGFQEVWVLRPWYICTVRPTIRIVAPIKELQWNKLRNCREVYYSFNFFHRKNFVSKQIIERYSFADDLSESMDEKELRLLLLLVTSCCQLLLLEEISKKRKRRKIWVKEWLRQRNTLEAYNTIVSEFQLHDHYSYRKYLRMNCETFKVSSLI